jgi:predicted RNase H-like HicB family nuclease
MPNSEIIGYKIAVLSKRVKTGYIAICPGVGGIYEEGKDKAEAIKNACIAVRAIMEARFKSGSILTKNSQYFKVIRRPSKSILHVSPPWQPPIQECTLILPELQLA